MSATTRSPLRICLSPKELAQAIGCGLPYVRDAIVRGHLVARTIGARSLIRTDEALLWFDSQPPTPSSKKESAHVDG